MNRAGFVRVVAREVRRMAASPFYILGLVVLPALGGAILAVMFGDGVVRDLPVAAADADRSPRSRQLLAMLDATPGLRVAFEAASMDEARRLVLRGDAYGIVSVPRGFDRDLARGGTSRVSIFYNAQFLLPASLIRRETTAAVAALSASIETSRRMAAGAHPDVAGRSIEPVIVDVQTVGNPALSYVPYLVTGLLPTLLQIFVMVMAVHAFGSELKDGTAGEWLEAAGGRAGAAMAGKIAPYAVHFIVMGLLMLAALFGWLGVPVRGSLGLIAGATALFVLAYLAMGFAAVALTGNLRLATSLAAFYSVPAFAFAGLTFPAWGMPAAGQAWSSLLPLTHYVRLVMGQSLLGTPAGAAESALTALAAFAVLPWLVLGPRMARLARNPSAWGRP
jgi:ABC-2 type transport system permease protein